MAEIFRVKLLVLPDYPETFKGVRLNPAKFPPDFFSVPGSKSVFLTVHTSMGLSKEFVIPINMDTGYVFLQTDKPIYTPNQAVLMRIITLNEDALPSDEVFKLQIKNPNDNIIEEKVFIRANETAKKPYVTYTYEFPAYPVFGKWSATVLYGYEFFLNKTIHFDLEEYVLPTFTVKLKTEGFVLPSTETIKIYVYAKYIYGEKVQGLVTFRLSVMKEDLTVTNLDPIGPKELEDGEFTLSFSTDEVKKHKDIGWFPGIKNSHLVVEATVVDYATGNKEVAVDNKTYFTTSPYKISFKRCLYDFKPGYITVFEADVTYADGSPAAGVRTNIKALADVKPMSIAQNTAVSDESGKIGFAIQTEVHHDKIFATIETTDPRYGENQALGIFMQEKFDLHNKPYIVIARGAPQRLQPGDVFSKMIYFEPQRIQDIYFMVVARGRILITRKLPPGQFKSRMIDFRISHEMVPSFRIVAFAYFQNKLIADSLKIDVERICNPHAQVSITPEFSIKEPGASGKFIIEGTKGTMVGLLGVDEAIYALSKQDLLTKSKIFDKYEKHDLGCGPGGGMNVNAILGKAGIVIGGKEPFTMANTCTENKRSRRSRSVRSAVVTSYTGVDLICCTLGSVEDKYRRSCSERNVILTSLLKSLYESCSRAFLRCCKIKEAQLNLKRKQEVPKEETKDIWYYLRRIFISTTPIMTSVGGGISHTVHSDTNNFDTSNFDTSDIGIGELDFFEPDFIESPEDEEIFESDVIVRSDFRETWIFKDIPIGENGTEEFSARLPHSITTWVIQAVSVSPLHGICVVEPQKLVSFKKIFLHLNLPYSVVRNEQVEIQATVFNYGDRRIAAVMYMYGAEDLCTGVRPGEKSERKRFRIDAHSSTSASFPVIPLKAGNVTIKVVVLTSEGSDVIQRILHVVHEGIPKEISIPIKLDPTNQQRRVKRQISTEFYSDTIDTSNSSQNTVIKLSVPEAFIPGTESCSIAALGDPLGTVIETSINNPESMFHQPGGCGEQNMMRLAPTLYILRYLKTTGKLTPSMEEKGYRFIRDGYTIQMKFKRNDGSYTTFKGGKPCLWLTAFVMKVFCQASKLVHIDNNVLRSGVKWLVDNQEPNGSFIEKQPVFMKEIMGGIDGKTPMTAFTLIALEECKCEEERLLQAKSKAVSYLQDHLDDVNTPLSTAIMAYALALSDSELKHAANEKLLSMAEIDEDTNMIYWITPDTAQSIQTAAYALLTQLLLDDLGRSNAIVNWINTQQRQSGSFKSTQDTVITLQALSEYVIKAQIPAINLLVNISSTKDKNFQKVLEFHEDNALILQDIQIDKLGGNLLLNTSGQGMGSLAVKCRYNLNVPPEDIYKYDVMVNISAKSESEESVDINQSTDAQRNYPADSSKRKRRTSYLPEPETSTDNLKQKNNKPKLRISLCVRYLGSSETGMSIVDVGIFSGFEPVIEDLQNLQNDPSHLIQMYEKSSRGVVFYLEKVPTEENYCFSFHVVQEYLVGNTQASVIKVYDYYNPDALCTKFYSLGSHSPLLQTSCEGGICKCAEVDCPPINPFSKISVIHDVEERSQKIREIVCSEYDYVWKGKLNVPVKKEGGFLNISFVVEEVIKEGVEKRDQIEGKIRTLLAPEYCDKTSPVLTDTTYLILGKDGEQYKNTNGDIWYRYMLNKNTAVHSIWSPHKDSTSERLHLDLISITEQLLEEGCQL